MRGPARLATYLGRILMVVGFLMIVFAWNGAASLDYIQGQFPYLLSGAMPGLALIIIGAGTEYIQAVRQYTARRAKQMAELNLSAVKLVNAVREHGLATRADVEQRVPVGAASGAAAGAFAPPADQGDSTDPASRMVVAGRSSFHTPDCHLVSGRDDLSTITMLEAEGQGLNRCRVCKP